MIEEINKKYKSECSISFELTNNKTNFCNHSVCLDCEKKINKCPLCRRNLNLLKRNVSTTHTMIPTISIINNVINEFSTLNKNYKDSTLSEIESNLKGHSPDIKLLNNVKNMSVIKL